ncbi:MAG: phospholipid/cholesterol/gamma-HCH transport system substrate-binding protein [Thermoleophilaceae bacterium]|nr:phospholipid/cholesterol/gamma-HCH transport system substrate-binding protein [Thermoleophilaceae bacterium]
MNKRALKKSQLAMMIVFAFSCFAILLYIWKAFGGPSPLAPKQYEVQADFSEATQLSETADVRVAGVTVGRVRKALLHGDKTRVTMEIRPEYAPIPRDTRAILRLKTLLGETYIELTPGNRAGGPLPDNAVLPEKQVQSTVELDEVQRALDGPTRKALQEFLRGLALSVENRGTDLNASLGNLHAFAADTDDLLAVLDTQHDAVRRLVADTGTVFAALGQRQGELQGLIRSGDRVLETTARRNADLADTVRILPTTLRELRPTLVDLEGLTNDARPVVRDLRPAARALGPTLTDAVALTPDLEGLFRDIDHVITVARTALPATTRFVHAARPVFQVLTPTLQQAKPVVDYLGIYKQEFTQMWANIAADTQGVETVANGEKLHYLRALVPVTAEGAAVQAQRYGTNRHNPYLEAGGFAKLATGLPAFDCSNTGNPSPPGQQAPPCKVQAPVEFQGRSRQYPHVQREP